MAPVVEAIVNAGIPVQGHIGLTPQTASALGGFKVQGKSADAARALLLEDAKALETAGCFSIVLEAIPSPIAQGHHRVVIYSHHRNWCRGHCDGQVLVIHDLVGLFDRFTPKFVKQYVKISDIIAKAIEEYKTEVTERKFPDEKHSFSMSSEELEKMKASLGKP
jgi:3-methyl-2-oxobutanoate hydroxymethyltransferase